MPLSSRKRGRSTRNLVQSFGDFHTWDPRFKSQVGTGTGPPKLSAKVIDALNAKELRTLLRAAVDGIKALDAKSNKKEGRNVYFFQLHEDVRAKVAQMRAEVAQIEKKIKEMESDEPKMQADELATARERDTNLRVEALEFNPKALRVFTSSDSYGTLIHLTDAILGGNRLWSGWMQIS
jgi:hypothetical protein